MLEDLVNLKTKLALIHKVVFDNFTYVEDSKQYGELEHWAMPPNDYDGSTPIIGDCEDFALACRKLCTDEGLKSRLVVCNDESGQSHCVLEVEGYILDNRQHRVFSRDWLGRYGYEWVAISGYEPGDEWQRL